MRLNPGKKIGHFEILSRLGAGGMGEVYLAMDKRLNRKVALKILPPTLAAKQDRMRRFNQEASAAAALNHPHIAHIYEIGRDDDLSLSPWTTSMAKHCGTRYISDGTGLTALLTSGSQVRVLLGSKIKQQ
jgi:serine/threonine protein kinase